MQSLQGILIALSSQTESRSWTVASRTELLLVTEPSFLAESESLRIQQLDVDKLRFSPKPPAHWPSFKLHYRYRETFYHITVNNSGKGNAIQSLSMDGVIHAEHYVCLVDDKLNHEVVIEL